MIYSTLLLPRDHNVKRATLGFSEQYVMKDGYGHTVAPSFGMIIGSLEPTFPTIIKLIEHYNMPNDENRSKFQDIFIERLCHLHKNYLFPYKIQYLTPRKQYDNRLVVPKNMENCHYNIHGYPYTITTPSSFYMSVLRPEHLLSNERNFEASRIYRQSYKLIESLCQDSLQWSDIFDKINNMSHNQTTKNRYAFRYIDEELDEHVRHALLPRIPYIDPITAKTLTSPIPLKNLPTLIQGLQYSDVRQPPELVIRQSSLTEFSPKTQLSTIYYINDLGLTDVEIEYILFGGCILQRKVVHAYDRYHRDLNIDREIDICDKCVVQCVFNAGDATTQSGSTEIFSDIRVVFRKTFNDEALFEIYTIPDDELLYACHLDLAVLSLCSIGVISAI